MKQTLPLIFSLFLSLSLHSQTIIGASGGDAAGNGTVSYTLGQTFYNTNIASNGSISEGAQQTIIISTLSNHELLSISLKAVIYPNPTSDYLTLEVENTDLKGLSYVLYDLLGRPIFDGKVLSGKTSIRMKNKTAGVYILKVNSHSKELKSFKIIKK